jgi:hypothetical protein
MQNRLHLTIPHDRYENVTNNLIFQRIQPFLSDLCKKLALRAAKGASGATREMGQEQRQGMLGTVMD